MNNDEGKIDGKDGKTLVLSKSKLWPKRLLKTDKIDQIDKFDKFHNIDRADKLQSQEIRIFRQN